MSEDWLVSFLANLKDSFQQAISAWGGLLHTDTLFPLGDEIGWPSWTVVIMVGLWTIICLPVSYITYIRYRIWSVGARVIDLKTYPWWYVRLFVPTFIYKDIVVSYLFLTRLSEVEKFEVRSDDVIVSGFPRSGTNWTQEMVYLIVNDADIEMATSDVLDVRVPQIELWVTDLKQLAAQPYPRVYKTHLQYHVLPREVETKRPRIIHVMRNPKDISVSYYKLFTKFFIPMKEDFDTFIDAFVEEKVLFGPWSDSVKGYWERRNQENILFMRYEDMRKDAEGTVRKIASFLGKNLSDKQIQTIVQHSSFDNMKQNDKANYSWQDKSGFTVNLGNNHVRKGKVGDWKNHLTPDQSTRIEKMAADALRGTDLTIDYGFELT